MNINRCLNCGKSIREKIRSAKYCSKSCGHNYRSLFEYYKKPKIYHPKMKDPERWALIGQNSSYKAMEEIYKKF